MVKDYMASCTMCTCAKSVRHKPYGKLKQLPASKDFSTILVVIDHLTKQAIFIPSHDTMNALQVAQLFLTHIFSKHGSHCMSHWTVVQSSYHTFSAPWANSSE